MCLEIQVWLKLLAYAKLIQKPEWSDQQFKETGRVAIWAFLNCSQWEIDERSWYLRSSFYVVAEEVWGIARSL